MLIYRASFPHALRQTFASRLGMSGVGDRALQALSRWKEPKMIQRYTHLTEQHLREAVGKIAENSPTIFTAAAKKDEIAECANRCKINNVRP